MVGYKRPLKVEEQDEAVRRMGLMGFHPMLIDQMSEHGVIWRTNVKPLGYDLEPVIGDDLQRIRDFELEESLTVYFVIRDYIGHSIVDTYFVIYGGPDYYGEKDKYANHGIVDVYVDNHSYPSNSGYKDIRVMVMPNGVVIKIDN